MVKRFNIALIISIVTLWIYHALMFCVEMEILNIEKGLLYPIHHIPMNFIIIVLILYLAKACILPKKIYWATSYFGLKIAYFSLSYIPKCQEFLRGVNIDIWLVSITSLIVAILWIVKLINKNGR